MAGRALPVPLQPTPVAPRLPFFFGSRHGGDDPNAPKLGVVPEGAHPGHAHAQARAVDQALFARIHAGDRAAFESCFERYFRPLWVFAYGYLHMGADAEEVVQEVFVSFWQRHESLDLQSTLAVSLYLGVKRQALGARRRSGVTVAEVPTTPAGVVGLASERSATSATTTMGELEQRLDAALDTLSPQRREMLRLRWVEGLELEEIAAIMEIPVSAVKISIQQCIGDIRPILEAPRRD